jgi:hypothetical protein
MEQMMEQLQQLNPNFDWGHFQDMMPQLPDSGSQSDNAPTDTAPAVQSSPA